ncbi:hypothetical protein ACIQAC_11955 [Streptomyces sp. NPDC088387]|uniref:hypothetical protein n=1 Tax=Streptomyces sp. NPDC088387 TaxID=3365859 RepID=UPI00381662EA
MTGTDGTDLRSIGLNEIAEGITLTLDELKELGMQGDAGVGRGFSDIALSGLELGHGGLTSAFGDFCERWEWGVRSLVNEGNRFASGVGLAAGTLHETDQYVDGMLKVGANSLMGNPQATEDEVTAMSWGELAQNHAYADADYSKESVEDAYANSRQGWMDASRDMMTSPMATSGISPLNPQRAAGMSDEEYEAFLDEAFGPSAEERAQSQPPPEPTYLRGDID